jgi:hypothetical protein
VSGVCKRDCLQLKAACGQPVAACIDTNDLAGDTEIVEEEEEQEEEGVETQGRVSHQRRRAATHHSTSARIDDDSGGPGHQSARVAAPIARSLSSDRVGTDSNNDSNNKIDSDKRGPPVGRKAGKTSRAGGTAAKMPWHLAAAAVFPAPPKCTHLPPADGELTCEVPSTQLDFCQNMDYPVHTPGAHASLSWHARDLNASAMFSQTLRDASGGLDTHECKLARKRLHCSLAFMRCNPDDVDAIAPVCRSVCDAVAEACGETELADTFCAESPLFVDDVAECTEYGIVRAPRWYGATIAAGVIAAAGIVAMVAYQVRRARLKARDPRLPILDAGSELEDLRDVADVAELGDLDDLEISDDPVD